MLSKITLVRHTPSPYGELLVHEYVEYGYYSQLKAGSTRVYLCGPCVVRQTEENGGREGAFFNAYISPSSTKRKGFA